MTIAIDLSGLTEDHRSKMKKIMLTVAAFLIVAVPLMNVQLAFAAAAVSLSAPGSAAKGATVTVSVYENSGGESVNAASVRLSYSADTLDFVGIASSGAFGIVAANSGGGGSVQIDRGALPAVSGRQLIGSVRLRAKVDSGTGTVAITSSSVVSADSNSNIASGGGSATIKFTPPAAAPTPTPEAPKDTIPPTIKDVAVKDLTSNTATVTWTTSEPATSEVDYGFGTGYGVVANDPNPVTDHKIVLNTATLAPNTEYHFVVKSVDPAGNAAADSDKTFKTKGAVLTVTVLDQNKKAVTNAKVEIGGASAVTNSKGQATLQDLQIGKTLAAVTYKGKQTVFNVTVKPIDPKNSAQAETFTIKVSHNLVWILVLPIIFLLAALAFIFRKRLQSLVGSLHIGAIGSKLPQLPKSKGPTAAPSAVIKPSVSAPSQTSSPVSPNGPVNSSRSGANNSPIRNDLQK
jgi:hypothetical protein